MYYEWAGRNLAQMFDSTSEEWPYNEALVAGERRLTYRRLQDHFFRFAHGLSQLGIGRGTHVAVVMDNTWEFAVVTLALQRLGAVQIPLNLAWTSREFIQAFNLTDSEFLITVGEFRGNRILDGLEEAMPELLGSRPGEISVSAAPTLRGVLAVNAGIDTPYAFNFDGVFASGEHYDRQRMLDMADEIDPAEPVMYLPTSGSTGFPKPVIHTHNTILVTTASFCDATNFHSSDRLLNFGTTYHVSGQVLLLLPWVRGGTAVTMNWFDPDEAVALIERERITRTWGFDTHFIMMRRSPALVNHDISTLTSAIIGSDPSGYDEVASLGISHHGNVYGCSEYLTNLLPYCDRHDIRRARNSHGRPLEGVLQKIVDPVTGDRVPVNTIGEICVKGPGLFKGYYNMPEESASVIDDEGYFHTGDYAYEDEDGYTYFRGRLKDTVKTGGENVSAKEVELFLQTETPWVRMVQVFGLPDERWGESVTAMVELADGVEVTGEQFREFCRGKLAGYKIPKRFIFVGEDDWIVTPTGKIDKQGLRQRVLDQESAPSSNEVA